MIEESPKIPCVVCKTEVTSDEISNFASFGGLPSPCCVICFEVNDYRIEDLQELKIKSLAKRILMEKEPSFRT